MQETPRHWSAYLRRWYVITGGVLVLLLVVGGIVYSHSAAPAPQTPDSNTTHVQVASVASLVSASGPLPVVGKVTSLSQASILAQTAGEITQLNYANGDHVNAGDVIASFSNASQQAAVVQAQGQLDAAEAAYQKALTTTAANSQISSANAQQGVAAAQTGVTTALSSAYGALDDAVHTRADALFQNPRTSSPQLSLQVPDSTLVSTLQFERLQLQNTLQQAQQLSTVTATTSLDQAVSSMITDAQTVTTFLSNLIKAVNETPPSQVTSAATLSAYQTSLAAARTEAVGAVSSLTQAKSAYDKAIAGASTASNTAQAGTTSDIAAAAASVKQAQGILDSAKAALEKTIVRSPISGTIVSLPITQGDYVSAYSPVATVSNPGALYVDTNVTPSDAQTLAVGNAATINGTIKGKITFVASAIDPSTNDIEVKVGLPSGAPSLTDGEYVDVALQRTQASVTSIQKTGITIPIVSAKILPSGPVVFTVSASSTLVAHPISFGSILGDRVVVTSGLTATDTIVTDARGLSPGQAVIVDSTK